MFLTTYTIPLIVADDYVLATVSWYHVITMIVVLTGDNAFALRSDLDAMVAGFAAEHGEISVERLDGEEMDFARLQESLQSPPFLAAKKLVVLRAPGANKQFVERAEALLPAVPETTEVIIVEPKLDKRGSYYKVLKKTASLREYPVLDVPELARWLTGEVQAQGGTISPADALFLIARVGTNQQILAHELDKLLIHSPSITREAIEQLTEPEPQSKVFDLLEAAFSGDAKRALALYREQRAQKVDPAHIIAMITWQLKALAVVMAARGRTSGEIARESKLSPFTIQKSQVLAKRLSTTRLRLLVADLLAIDYRSKRENIDLDEALQNYVLMLSR